MRSSALSRVILLMVLGVLVAPVSSAAAAQRYASPLGSGLCHADDPCSIVEAMEYAGAGDEVIVEPGDYLLPTYISVKQPITIHGVAGKPRPRLQFTSGGLRLDHAGALLRYVEVDQASTYAWALYTRGSVDQAIVRGSGAVWLFGGTVRNSVIVSSHASGSAIMAGDFGDPTTATLRNVTAIASGSNGVAIRAFVDDLAGAGATSLDVINTIARGGAGGADVLADSTYQPVEATITLTGSNYAIQRLVGSHGKIVDGGGNQSAAPVFVNPEAGDYREAASSPTIDHGLDVPLNGAFDIDGDVRRIATTDIGADEFVFAPVPTTLPASDVTEHSVTLNGSVDPRGMVSTYHFEYGTSTAYGTSTPETTAGSSIKTTPASSAPSDLTAGTTYHYRLVATNSGGVSLGTDQTFRTAGTAPAAPAASAPSVPAVVAVPSTPPAPAAFGGVRLASTKLTLARGTIRLTLRCPAGTVGGCSGKTRLSARRHEIGQATFSIAPGRQGTVKLRVTRTGRRLLSSTRRVNGKAVNAAHDGAGQASSTAASVTIRRLRMTRVVV